MVSSIMWGLSIGLATASFNHCLVSSVRKRLPGFSPPQTPAGIMCRYMVRLFVSVVVLYLLRNDVPMLLAALGGMVAFRNLFVVAYVLAERRRR